MTFDPTFVEVTQLKYHCLQVQWPMQMHQCGYSNQNILTKDQRPQTTPRWPLIPHPLRSQSYVQLYLRTVVFNFHKNTSKHVDTVTFFFKNFNQRPMIPRWPLTPLLLRSHVWHYQRIIVPKSHGTTSIFVDTVINVAKLTHTTDFMYIHIHMYMHTQIHIQTDLTFRFPSVSLSLCWLRHLAFIDYSVAVQSWR